MGVVPPTVFSFMDPVRFPPRSPRPPALRAVPSNAYSASLMPPGLLPLAYNEDASYIVPAGSTTFMLINNTDTGEHPIHVCVARVSLLHPPFAPLITSIFSLSQAWALFLPSRQ